MINTQRLKYTEELDDQKKITIQYHRKSKGICSQSVYKHQAIIVVNCLKRCDDVSKITVIEALRSRL